MRLAPGDSERYYMSAQILPTAHRLLGPAPEDWMWPREAPEALGGSGKILGDSGRYLYFPDALGLSLSWWVEFAGVRQPVSDHLGCPLVVLDSST